MNAPKGAHVSLIDSVTLADLRLEAVVEVTSNDLIHVGGMPSEAMHQHNWAIVPPKRLPLFKE